MTEALKEEQKRLDWCLSELDKARNAIDKNLDERSQEIQERKSYLWEARRDMDHIEKIAVRQTIEQSLDSADFLQKKRNRIEKLLKTPYFGRFDFQTGERNTPQPVYIGIHHFQPQQGTAAMIYDWRAPIASMFYDFEPGSAFYQSPDGLIRGRLTLKRQFRIQDGKMELLIESDVHIVDDLLQQELGRSSNDNGMKNIVATIQRDQNAIIRNDESDTLIIQGVAGSGKTSIALHRIAYLLYRFKETLSSRDILIISPNKVFAAYIGNVLPELGEERVTEVGIEELADELLDHAYRFQTSFEQTTQLLEGRDTSLSERITAKASTAFLRTIDRYVEHLEANTFSACEWRLGRKIVPAWHFEECWKKHRGLAFKERIKRVIDATELQIGIHYNYDLEPAERKDLRELVHGMVRKNTLREAYKNLFAWMNEPALFKPHGGKLEYADVFPLIYLKIRLEGINNPRHGVKHLLIDEMQDYTPLQYAVLARLFPCRKTILGDITQSVNPFGSAGAQDIQQALRAGTAVKLTKSYRSTWEIMQVAQAIYPNPELQALPRHGPPPVCKQLERPHDMIRQLVAEINQFTLSDHKSIALIAKTGRQATALFKGLAKAGIQATHLDAQTRHFATGVVICTPHLAKGLEFDRVVVTDASDANYQTELDKRLLYVACTRAMHQLSFIATGPWSRFLEKWAASTLATTT